MIQSAYVSSTPNFSKTMPNFTLAIGTRGQAAADLLSYPEEHQHNGQENYDGQNYNQEESWNQGEDNQYDNQHEQYNSSYPYDTNEGQYQYNNQSEQYDHYSSNYDDQYNNYHDQNNSEAAANDKLYNSQSDQYSAWSSSSNSDNASETTLQASSSLVSVSSAPRSVGFTEDIDISPSVTIPEAAASPEPVRRPTASRPKSAIGYEQMKSLCFVSLFIL